MIGAVLRLVLQGLKDLGLNPWAQALTLAAVTLVAFLGGLFLLFIHNLDRELAMVRGEVLFQVYWKLEADPQAVAAQWEALADLPALSALATYTPDQALDELATKFSRELELDQPGGVIPHTALLAFNPAGGEGGDRDAGAVEDWSKQMLMYLQHLDGVRAVHVNPLRTDLARAWTGASRAVVWPVLALLSLILALVVGNTIKLSLLSRRREIDILRLVGAARWYIQLPLLVGGAVQGLVGGVLALGLLRLARAGLADAVALLPLELTVRFLPLSHCLAIPAVLAAVCLAASWVAVKE